MYNIFVAEIKISIYFQESINEIYYFSQLNTGGQLRDQTWFAIH